MLELVLRLCDWLLGKDYTPCVKDTTLGNNLLFWVVPVEYRKRINDWLHILALGEFPKKNLDYALKQT